MDQSVMIEAAQRPRAEWRRWVGAFGSSFIVRRILKALFTIFFVTSLLFFLIRLMPSNPLQIYIGELMSQYSMSYQDAASQAASLFSIDFNAPLWQQYLNYLGDLLRGNLGLSLRSTGTPVSLIIRQFLPWTLFSVGVGLLLSFIVGIGLGMIMAYRRESWLDNILSLFASITTSITPFLIGIMMIVFVAVQWRLVNFAELRGATSPGIKPGFTWTFLVDIFRHAALPIATYIITTVGFWMLSMRNSTLATLGEDYVLVARARGLSDGRIATAYVGRNAALPLVTQFTLSLATLIGGSAVIERLFSYQGIGLQLINSVIQRDYSVMQGIFLILTVSVVVANLVTDLCYGLLDPRIRIGKSE
ncbi:MAG TPA: ABC transporter permease [Roseiflexaceae bacterium]|jgi:peptide/nickel transport system permease protein|nr:ABC transporter permease [Roseiflexaceae bacterium]